MGGETERLEREINAYLTGLPGFDLDVYRDIFSSEYVNNVIYNHPERIRRIQPVLDRLGFIRNTHFVLTMIFDNFWNICQKRDNAYRYQLKRSLLNHTREALGRLHPASVAATLIGTDKVVVLLECADMAPQAAEDYAYCCAQMLRDDIMANTTFSVSIGVSRYCRSQALAWRAYEQSFQALSGSFAVGYAQVLRPQEKKAAENVVRQNEVAAIAKRFSVAISAGRPELCQKYVDHLFQRLSIIMADENYIRSYVVPVLSEVMQYCIRLGMDANDLSQRLVIMIQQVFQAGTIAKLQESTTEFLKRMIQQDNGRERFSRNRMNIAHAYIEQFYAEDISLGDMARLCGCSEAYFCRQFKKTYGKTYTDLLSQCRMERARELLEEDGDSSISAIAEAVGFHSFSHFCVCFRKATGQTPSAYRRDRLVRAPYK